MRLAGHQACTVSRRDAASRANHPRHQRELVLDDVVHHCGEHVTVADFITRIGHKRRSYRDGGRGYRGGGSLGPKLHSVGRDEYVQ
jgi:hypothetical protein